MPLKTYLHRHPDLDIDFTGILLEKEGIPVVQYRGLQYAAISERFEAPTLVEPGPTNVEGLEFGPECPQVRHDIRMLFGIPDEYPEETPEQDEFKCLNLVLTTPASFSVSKLPVMIWIHGGAQLQSVEGPASRMSDTGRFVADSVNHGMPIIVAAMNYRLNIFGLGDGKGERNLALQDQRCAIEWVRKYVAGFGGDPDNITLAGESAGGTYIHAHSILGTPAKRAILQSGNLWTLPPRPINKGSRYIERFQESIAAKGGRSMREAPVKMMLDTLEETQVGSMWLDMTADLEDWELREEKVEELMVGDCEFEAILWLQLLLNASPQQIAKCFDILEPFEAQAIKKMYGIDGKSKKACRQGALNWLGDYRFNEPNVRLAKKWRTLNKPFYQYLLDEVNPFRQSLGAHHGVDILLLFGDYDLSKTPAIQRTAIEMRKRWILFVNGKQPWQGSICAFGPLGVCDELDDGSATNRRRWEHFKLIDKLRPKLEPVVTKFMSDGFWDPNSKI